MLTNRVSLWLAGHLEPDEIGKADRPKTDEVREAMLALFVKTVRDFLPTSEQVLLARAEPFGPPQ